MPPVRFEPTILAGERPQTQAIDRVVTGTGKTSCLSTRKLVHHLRKLDCSCYNQTFLADKYNSSFLPSRSPARTLIWNAVGMRMLKTAPVMVPEAKTRAGGKACLSACVFLSQLTSMRQANGAKWTEIYWKSRVKWPISLFNVSWFVILKVWSFSKCLL
jgi:hypothetical protein